MRKSNQFKPILIITGGSGFIGRALTHTLCQTYEVICLDIVPPASLPPDCHYFKCDLTDENAVNTAIDIIALQFGEVIEAVIHLAAHYNFDGEPDEMYEQLTIEGTRRLVSKLRFLELKQFIFASTLLVMDPFEFDDQSEDKIDEASKISVDWPYPESKLKVENMLLSEKLPFPIAILRIAGVYTDYCDSLPLSSHIKRIYNRELESFFYPGDPESGQAFIHIDDLTRAFQQTIERQEQLGSYETFLISEPEPISHKELQNIIGFGLYGTSWPTIKIPKAVAKVGARLKDSVSSKDAFIKPWMIDHADDHFPVSIDHAAATLDWHPKRRIAATVPMMIASLKQDPHRWLVHHGFKDKSDTYPSSMSSEQKVTAKERIGSSQN